MPLPNKKPASEPSLDGRSIALVTSPVEGVRTSGTAFCVRKTATDSLFVTCRHVVVDLDSGSSEIRVDGHPALEIANGDEFGVDLSVLSVAGANYQPLELAQAVSPKVDDDFKSVGFRHLYADHYFSSTSLGKVDRLLTVRRQLAKVGASSFRVAAEAGYEVYPGMSGSPVCNSDGKVIGVMAFASQDGRSGFALCVGALSRLLPAMFDATPTMGTASVSDSVPPPPTLPKVKNDVDLQSGRFGGKADDGAVQLDAELQRQVGKNYFIFDAVVRPVVNSRVSITGPARFYLHDTFPRNMIQIRKPSPEGAFKLEDIHAYGVFTLGCQVYCSDGLWHSLELDLTTWGATVGLSDVFLTR